jgi:thermitase
MPTTRATFARPATARLVLLSGALVAVLLAGASASRATAVEVTGPRAQAVLGALETSPQVDFAERDAVSRASSTPNDPEYDGSANPCSGSLACWPYQNIDLAPVWNATTGSSSVIVAVVDTGVDASHEDLSGAVLTGCNLVSGTITGGICSDTDTGDDNGHGTEAAGLIAARIDNGLGIAGVCGSCKILPVKALSSDGSGSDSNIALGIEWAADHGAQVINLSLAVGAADPVLHDAVAYAVAKGALVVAGAGNAGSSNPTTYPGGYPAAFTAYPDSSGGAPIGSGLISVGAGDYYNHLYPFSNYGSWVDVSASGCGISTTDDGGYSTSGFCGTSAATPFVSGVAALLLSYSPSLTPAQLQSDITSSATAITLRTLSNGSTVACGSDCVRYGRLSALGALEAAGYSATVAPAISGSGVPRAPIRPTRLGTLFGDQMRGRLMQADRGRAT